jgi:hypothetical protein
MKGRKRAVIVVIGVALPVAALAAYLSTRPAKAPPPEKPEGDLLEPHKRERLAKAPCDTDANVDLVEHLMINRRWQDALDVANKSLACGELGDMTMKILTCYQQLHRWTDAARVVEPMIADHPRDSNVWWWHGETWRYRDENLLAMIDFRQSLANAYWNRGSIAVRLFMYAAEPAGAACEADRAWRYYQKELDGTLDDEARNLLADLDRGKTCVPERGTGRAKLQLDKRIRATIGGTTAELLVDPRAGTTILSRELAERAGIVTSTTGQTATLWSEVRIMAQPARAARISIGGTAATNVEIAISDDLAVGDDGVIGLSYLWHFDMVREEHAVALSPPH